MVRFLHVSNHATYPIGLCILPAPDAKLEDDGTDGEQQTDEENEKETGHIVHIER